MLNKIKSFLNTFKNNYSKFGGNTDYGPVTAKKNGMFTGRVVLNNGQVTYKFDVKDSLLDKSVQ